MMSVEAQGSSNRRERGERNRLKILRALSKEKGWRATTSAIKGTTGIETDTIRYHCGKMEEDREPPLVKFDGKEKLDSETLSNPNAYRLTEHGRNVVDSMGDEKLSLEEAEEFAELRTALVETQNELEELQEAHNELVKTVRKMVEGGEIGQTHNIDHTVEN